MPGVVLVGLEGQVVLTLAQIVGLGAVTQPGQFQVEGAAGAVTQEHQFEGAVGGVLLPHRRKVQGLLVKSQALFQIQNVEVEVVKSQHNKILLLCSLSE